jgi:LmbE family N-acetylglucosaminyl deacetylase
MTPDDLVPTPRRVLAVCAHPDDESFGLGAVISTLIDQGASIDLVCLTQGEASTLGSPLVDLARARRGELAAAAHELGITAVHQFDHPDGYLSTVDLGDLVAAIEPVAEHHDLLLVFDEGGITGHADHIHATAAAIAVAEQLDLPVLAWTLDRHVADTLNTEYDARFVGRADNEIHVRLPVDRRRQRAAMRCHDSQITGNPVPERRIALTGDTEPLRYLRRAHATTHDTKDHSR